MQPDSVTCLRSRGKLEAMKQAIRKRETAFQGSINLMLASFDKSSEARQCSGPAV
jgi:FPC/CPF motif-containing protein YcgG